MTMENSAKAAIPQKADGRGLRTVVMTLGVLAALVVSVLAAVLYGTADLTVETVIDVLKLKILGIETAGLSNSSVQIVWNLRMPRAILAIAAGGGLAISGAAMQAITQNELADPYILGVSGGASAMASLAFFLGGVFASTVFVQVFAFSGAIIALFLVYSIGVTNGGGNGARLVLAGMAISIVMNAISQMFITLSSTNTTRSITMWLMGSLSSARWETIVVPLIICLAGLVFFILFSRAYDLVSLGDETAIGLGVNAAQLKRLTGVAVALVSGIVVSACGVIGLVGFVIPHIVRIILGSRHRRLFPVSFLVGSLFLIWMDLLARFVMAPQEVPIGIFTALCGGPFFVWLLYRQTHAGRK